MIIKISAGSKINWKDEEGRIGEMKMRLNTVTKFLTFTGLFLVTGVAALFAQEHGAVATATTGDGDILKWLALSSGLAIGLSTIGGALGQGKLVAQAMEGISRNPQASKDMFTPLILGLAFIEALTFICLIFGFVFKKLVMGA